VRAKNEKLFQIFAILAPLFPACDTSLRREKLEPHQPDARHLVQVDERALKHTVGRLDQLCADGGMCAENAVQDRTNEKLLHNVILLKIVIEKMN
jgi:hypothetical protein